MGRLRDFIDKITHKKTEIVMTPALICLKEYCKKRADGSEDIIQAYEELIENVALRTGAPIEVAAIMSYAMLEEYGVEEN